MLRLNDALNTASALFVDGLFDGATAWAEPYRKLPAFKEGRELYHLWRELDPEVPEGDEARLVDAFAEHLRIRDWYTWKPDPANRS